MNKWGKRKLVPSINIKMSSVWASNSQPFLSLQMLPPFLPSKDLSGRLGRRPSFWKRAGPFPVKCSPPLWPNTSNKGSQVNLVLWAHRNQLMLHQQRNWPVINNPSIKLRNIYFLKRKDLFTCQLAVARSLYPILLAYKKKQGPITMVLNPRVESSQEPCSY